MSRPLRRLGWPVTHTVGGPRQVCLIRCDALVQRVRPAEPLKPGRGLGVAQIGIVAAVAADDLERAGVAAFGSARNDANRLAAEERSAGLPVGISKSERHPCQFRHSPQNRFHVRQIRPYHISARRFQLILKGDPRRYRHTARTVRSEEHTSELQSPYDLVCRVLLEKKKNNKHDNYYCTRKKNLKNIL